MPITLYHTANVSADTASVARLVNDLQHLFVVRSSGNPVRFPPNLKSAFPPNAPRIGKWFQASIPAASPGTAVLITSNSLGLPPLHSVYRHSQRVTIISDHEWLTSQDETAILLARHILKIGMEAFRCHRSPVQTCICSTADPQARFDCLCQQCESHLAQLGFRDGIRRLKEALNRLNQAWWETAFRPAPTPESAQADTALRLANFYARKLHNARQGPPFRGCTILLVLHFLSDLIPFVDALHCLGCDYENIHLVAKPYPYSRRDEVSHTLESRGVNIQRASASVSVEQCAETTLRALAERKPSAGSQKVLVIEDGGYFAPLLHRREFSALLRRCVGIVEQTQKGINNDRKRIQKRKLKVPILSVAESRFKKDYESPEIGRVAIQNISRFTPNTKLSGHHAIVFGFGSVGREVASHLTNAFNMAVSVVDTDQLAELRAQHCKAFVAEAADQFANLRYGDCATLVVGTTGRLSIDQSVLRALPDGAVIVSTSSDQVEIDLKSLARLAKGRVKEIALGKHEFTIENARGRKTRLTLLAEGYPINFYGSESLPNDTIDPVMTLLLLCAVELALGSRKSPPTYKPRFLTSEVNDITDKYNLVRQFLRFDKLRSPKLSPTARPRSL
ncbi:MAG TPA: NAD(P)-dependent oxidoreductase [Candidatus Binatia bacterium]|jgi:S-adenosylhomocysteine hydrolase|nr:NAD(P)-dependent oxidoreductase [Candidatus Binatia bacterium]